MEEVLSFFVEGRPVPWKAPTFVAAKRGRKGIASPRLVAWQKLVRLRAGQFAPRQPWKGPVRLDVCFFLRPRPSVVPDRTNLLKALEDALEGLFYENDRQVEDGMVTRMLADETREGVSVCLQRIVAVRREMPAAGKEAENE